MRKASWLATLIGLVTSGCSHYEHQLFSERFREDQKVSGSFQVKEEGFYSIAIESVVEPYSTEKREEISSYLIWNDPASPLVAGVSLRSLERLEGNDGEVLNREVVNPKLSSANSTSLTISLATVRLEKGRYEMEVSVQGKDLCNERLVSSIVVEHAYIGK